MRHCDQRLTFVVSEQKTHDLGVCENSQDIQWQNLLRGRDKEYATSPGLVVGRRSVGRSGHDEAGRLEAGDGCRIRSTGSVVIAQ